MGKPKFDIGRIVQQKLDYIWQNTSFTVHQKRMLQAIADCRTPALGAHKIACTDCGNIQIAYNSCRNRNCPKCQSRDREKWIRARESELLPVTYFHVVFTLPQALNPLCRSDPKLLYNCLFRSAWYTIQKLGKDQRWLGAQMGMTAVLHTWGSNLSLHPHVHCIVPGGGITENGCWKNSQSDGRYLFNRAVMGLVFRAKFVKELRKLLKSNQIPKHLAPQSLFKQLFKHQWITYAKRPFGSPSAVVEYLGRYSHKVAITNYRITNVSQNTVSFRYKDYRKKGKQKIMKLCKEEFIRRFTMHIVPHRFVRIRHYGILANRNKKEQLKIIREDLDVDHTTIIKCEASKILNELELLAWCKCCKRITVQLIIDILPPVRGSPQLTLFSDKNNG